MRSRDREKKAGPSHRLREKPCTEYEVRQTLTEATAQLVTGQQERKEKQTQSARAMRRKTSKKNPFTLLSSLANKNLGLFTALYPKACLLCLAVLQPAQHRIHVHASFTWDLAWRRLRVCKTSKMTSQHPVDTGCVSLFNRH